MSLSSKIYLRYKHSVYPRIKFLRGTTRFLEILERFAFRNLESVDEPTDNILDIKWDNLIILDACRYDIYQETVDEEVHYRITQGSTSREFVEKNFGKSHDDIVYITANGFLADEYLEDIVGVKNPFYEKYETLRTDWDDELGATRPESVVRDAKNAAKLFPDKRIIVHFIQPHYPYIDYNLGEDRDGSNLEEGSSDNETALDKAEKGDISREKILEAYRHNLEEVLAHAKELNEDLSGKTIVTADHGELLGEEGLYGHPGGKNSKKLRKVPWHEL